jgi:hypothetical protein
MVQPNGPEAVPERPAAGAAAGAGVTPEEAPERLRRATGCAAAAGLFAGLLAFGAGEAAYQRIPAEAVTFNTMGTMVTATTAATVAVAEVRNAAVAFGLLGLGLGLCLGIAGGLARRSATAAVQAGLLGAILGAALGAGASLALLPRLTRMRTALVDYELILAMIAHGSIWGLTGALAGLAFAVGLGERRLWGRALVGGCAGAVLAAVAFDLIGAALFPLADTGAPISTTWPTRLLARLLVGVGTAGLIVLLQPSPRLASAARRPEIAPPGP